MSAFICSDLHIASLSKWFTDTKQIESVEITQSIANSLKRINIKSVDYRYDEKSRVLKCSLKAIKEIDANIALKLAQCLDYQSCELPNYRNPVLEEIMRLSGTLRDYSFESDVWDI